MRFFVLLLLTLWTANAVLWAQGDRTVVIISWDGGKPSVIRQMVKEARLPNIYSLLIEGSYSWTAQTIVPSSTLQSHTSMVTGLTMQRHGVTWNDKFREEKGFVKVPTIFELAKKAGLKTA
ncbi:MAG: alkaline phosphatase family protein, partial [Armatimonadota bacterium]|nr:alkaline phosphatase family protein [Armatimonadota bacterium]